MSTIERVAMPTGAGAFANIQERIWGPAAPVITELRKADGHIQTAIGGLRRENAAQS